MLLRHGMHALTSTRKRGNVAAERVPSAEEASAITFGSSPRATQAKDETLMFVWGLSTQYYVQDTT